MRALKLVVSVGLSILLSSVQTSSAQVPVLDSGDVTVRLTQGLDSSAQRPGQATQGVVSKSTNSRIPTRSIAVVQLINAQSGGFSVQLVGLSINGQIVRTASSAVMLAPDLLGSIRKYTRVPGAPPQDAVSGARVFLPQDTAIKFTLTDPPPAPEASPARIAQKRPVQHPPASLQHPAATVLDLPPAGPEYPSLHATHEAEQDCWWVPFVSNKFAIEMAVQQCAKKENNAVYGESQTGITLQVSGGLAGSQPETIFEVLSKPADQPIETAIQKQLISKLKSPAARSSCRPKRDEPDASHVYGPYDSYSVAATGAYAKQKRFNRDDDSSDSPCPGLTTDDAIGRFILYSPSLSKTTFFFFQQADYGSLINAGSIRFKAAQSSPQEPQ